MLAGVAAAGALAVAFGVQGVQAAIAEEAAIAKLATTLGNLGMAESLPEVEAFIDAQQRATGVADDELRPAFDRLIRSTRDVTEAQNLLKLAQDVSAGTGRSLETVVMALGKAADGSTTALGKLGAGIDKATLASGDLDAITAQLGETFAGQAAAKAATLQGQMDRLRIAVDEAGEIGRAHV